MRFGLDFGTSTTQLALKVDDRPPRLLELEPGTTAMPSYVALDPDGRLRFGREALNLAINVHSLKLLLKADEPIDKLAGMRPSQAAFELLTEVLQRGLVQLRRERLVPASVERVEFVGNVGCSPAWSLEQRTRLQDICRQAGLMVDMRNLVEEPTAAVFEIARSGLAVDGRLMVVDLGGGTVDIAVARAGQSGQRFELFATGGADLGGDRVTQVVVDVLKVELAARRGARGTGLALSPEDETLLWQRAEAAKIDLSALPSTRVALPGLASDQADVELTAAWLDRASRANVEQIVNLAKSVYHVARLTLDRGGEDDKWPGRTDIERADGTVSRVTELRLEEDGLEHLDAVMLIGGASRMPALKERFSTIFGTKLIDVSVVGLDPIEVVGLGLGRQQSLDTVELRYPNWGVSVVFRQGAEESAVTVYEPYAPVFTVGLTSSTSSYSVDIAVPGRFRSGSACLRFQPVSNDHGADLAFVSLGACSSLRFQLDLFGNVQLVGDGAKGLYPPDTCAPWKELGSPPNPAWIQPPPWHDAVPIWDSRNDGPG